MCVFASTDRPWLMGSSMWNITWQESTFYLYLSIFKKVIEYWKLVLNRDIACRIIVKYKQPAARMQLQRWNFPSSRDTDSEYACHNASTTWWQVSLSLCVVTWSSTEGCVSCDLLLSIHLLPERFLPLHLIQSCFVTLNPVTPPTGMWDVSRVCHFWPLCL